MGGPWEKYAAKPEAEAPGPWSKYQAQAAPSGPSESESAIRQGISGFTANLDDEFIGGVGAAGRLVGIKNLGSFKPFDPGSKLEFATEPLSIDEIVSAYRRNRDATRADQKADLETNPKASIAGTLVGAVASPLGKLKIGKSGKLASDIKTAAAQSAVFGAGASDSDLTNGEIGQFAKDTAFGAATGAAIPPALKAAGAVARGGAKMAGWTGKKIFNGTLGLKEENVSKYLASPERINAAKSLGEIKDIVDESVGVLREAVDQGKATEAEAKEALRSLKEQVTRGLGDKKVDAKDALRAADVAFQGAREKVLAPLKATSAPTHRAADASAMVGELKAKVRGLSGEALETLEGSPAKIELKGALASIDDSISRLSEEGTDEALAAIEKLKAYKERLLLNTETKQIGFQPSGKLETVKPATFENEASLRASGKLLPARWIHGNPEDQWVKSGLIGKEIAPAVEVQPIAPKFGSEAAVSAPKAKRLIQGLDKITEYSPMAGSFDKAKNRAFKGVRAEIDEALKNASREYREKMLSVAPESALLEEANAAFGSPEIAVGKLGRLNTPRGEFDRATLAKLEESVGKPGAITKEADQFASAQRILKDPQALKRIEQGLPEYQTYRQALADVAKRNPKWTRAQIEQATAKERRNLAEAASRRIFAEKAFEPFKGLSPGSTENKIKSVMKGARSNIENRAVLERLGKESGQDFIQMADDLAVKDAFEGGNTNGSRNTLFWGAVGLITGGLPGALGGAAFGHQVIDKYGPRLGKKMLDAAIKVRENPSVKTIRGLSLPQEMKAELEREFRVFIATRDAAEGAASRKVAQGETDRKPADLKGPDRWAQTGAEKLGLDPETSARLMSTKEGKRLLIEASDLPAGGKAMKRIKEQIEKGGAR